MAAPNPFTPDFGQLPPLLAGRDEAIGRMARVLAAGPARKEFTTLMLGPRGVGKTTMASAIADEAAAAGWRVIRIDAPLVPPPEEGAVAAITERIYEHLDGIDPPPKRRLTGAVLPVIGSGATWENASTHPPTFRKQLDMLVTATVENGGAGVLLVIDEFHNLTAPDASRIAGALQQITKIERKPLAFIGIGLPHIDYTLLTNEGFTFFQRCNRERIGNITIHDAMEAIEGPIVAHGGAIDLQLLRRAAAATRGMGYAIQSIGYHIWELAGPPPAEIATDHVARAATLMDDDVAHHVTGPIWSRLSPTDKLFLFAMLEDDGPSRLRDIGLRLGTAAPNTSAYKKRLLDQGAILETGRGRVTFAGGAIRYRAIEERDLELMIRNRESRERAEALAVTGHNPAAAIPLSQLAATPACDAWMPRAKAQCVLKAGHRGSHRRHTVGPKPQDRSRTR